MRGGDGCGVNGAEPVGTLALLKLDLVLGLIDGDFEVAHEGHPQQPKW